MFKSSHFATNYPFIKQFALNYESYSIWRSFIVADLLMPLFTSISISLLKSANNRIRIPSFSVVISLLLLVGAAVGFVNNLIVIAAKESLSGYGTKVYDVFNAITGESIKQYLTFFAILSGISVAKVKE
jgi:hypothetical protein